MTPPRRTAIGVIALVPMLLLGACSSLESGNHAGWSSSAEGRIEGSPSPSPTIESAQDESTEDASLTVEVLTQEERWAESLQQERAATVRGLASVLGIRRSLVRDNVGSAVDACSQTSKAVGLERRARAFGVAMTGDAGAVTRERAIAGITLVLTAVCPEVLDKHAEQVERREVRLREARERQRKRAARERRRLARERARVERERREAAVRAEELRQERSQQPSSYYANCTEARAAGAAPVRRGQPGYGDHLDRDGDGIGCE